MTLRELLERLDADDEFLSLLVESACLADRSIATFPTTKPRRRASPARSSSSST